MKKLSSVCVAFSVAVTAALLGFALVRSDNMTELLKQNPHRIAIAGPGGEVVGGLLAEQLGAAVVKTSELGDKSFAVLSKSLSSLVVVDDNNGGYLANEFTKITDHVTFIVLIESFSAAGTENVQHSSSQGLYNENVSKLMDKLKASSKNIPVVRMDASKTAEEIKSAVYAEIKGHEFLTFYSKFSRCGPLSKVC